MTLLSPAIGARAAAAAAPEADARRANAAPRVKGFLLIAAQLAGLGAVFEVFELETPIFRVLAWMTFGLFALCYWTPFAWKEPLLVAATLALSPLILAPPTALALVLLGLGVLALVSLPVDVRLRIALVALVFAALIWARTREVLPVPEQFWPVVGGVFGLRIIGYLYDVRHARGRPDPVAYLAYFFQLPNFYFLFYPVVDFETMRQTRWRRDIHAIAADGTQWILRGAVQLLLYRLVYHRFLPPSTPDSIDSPWRLLLVMVATYALYLRISGHFHLIVGMLHLFGYDLPETHRRYFLATSPTDFWRRINIYWKDFMVKVVFLPVYFRLRRRGDLAAKVVGTVSVFLATWLLHGYVTFWWTGRMEFGGPSNVFWGVLGAIVVVNVVLEARRGRRPPPSGLRRVAQTAGTFLLIATLWYLWQRPSLADWWELVTWWRIG